MVKLIESRTRRGYRWERLYLEVVLLHVSDAILLGLESAVVVVFPAYTRALVAILKSEYEFNHIVVEAGPNGDVVTIQKVHEWYSDRPWIPNYTVDNNSKSSFYYFFI